MMDMKSRKPVTPNLKKTLAENIKVYLHEPALSTAKFALQSLSPHKHTNCHTYHFKMHKILVCSELVKQCILSNLSHVSKSQKCNVAHTQELFTILKVIATNREILFYQQFSKVLRNCHSSSNSH